jgi:hypothetical protein
MKLVGSIAVGSKQKAFMNKTKGSEYKTSVLHDSLARLS